LEYYRLAVYRLLNPYFSSLRKFSITYWLLFFFITFCFHSQAQQPVHYSYQYYNSTHGLPSPEILCLEKDAKGFLWIGTASGLSMYDGYSFRNHSYAKQTELIGRVNVLKPDAANRLWVGSGSGLFCIVNNEIIKISSAIALPQGVNDILPGENGVIWLATENGPVQLNTGNIDFTGTKKTILTDYILPQWKLQSEENRRTTHIGKAPDNTVFISQYHNLFRFSNNQLELIHSTTGIRDEILTLFPVSRSKIYFDAASTEINLFENDSVAAIPFKEFYQAGQGTRLPGHWYVGTRGAFYFHPQTGIASRFIRLSDQYAVWPSAILEDNDFLWVATHDGLVKLKPSVFTIHTVAAAAPYIDFYSVAELKNKSLLFGANAGKVFLRTDSVITSFKNRLVPGAEIKDIYEDVNGWLWLASGYQGLVVIRNGNPQRFTIENGLHDNSLYQFLKTTDNRLYVFGDEGLSEILVDKNGFISFKKYYFQPNTSQFAKFYSGIEAPDGSIWAGGEEGLIYLRNDSLHRLALNGQQLYINFMLKDNAGDVWIAAAGEGILQCRFNNNNEPVIINRFTEKDGLNTTNYLSLLADADNNIWAASSKGISLIGRNGKYRNRVLNFNESDGFIKAGYSYIRLRQASDKRIWAATVFGIVSFQPDQLAGTDSSPLVYISGIQQMENNQAVTGYTDGQFPVTKAFSYLDNSFNFNFAALDYTNQQNIRYYYKLEGLDSNWRNNGDLRSVSFQNLSPGNYLFRVKALNSKGIWSKNDALYAFRIIPPFWKTWWFLSALIVTIVALLLFAINRRIRFIKTSEAKNLAFQKLKASSYKEQLEIEQIINYFATSMNSVNSIDDVLWDVAKNCISRLDFEDCVIYLKDEDTNLLVQKAAWGPKTSEENNIINPIALSPGSGIVGSVAISGKPEIISNTTLDKRYVTDDIQRMSEITVPIINNGEVIGIIDSEHSQEGFYSQRHLQILTTIASLCAGKITTLRAEQRSREKELEVLRLNKDFATSQLTALRMQMNPHFIFNALNSVQHYILQGNVVEANKYLSKFSKLQREILHCSDQQFITLEKEIEILSWYLELEQFRFGESFTYQINKSDEIEPEELKIPPMVLQPFVENAIWHGLMPRHTERILTIYFDLYSDDILQVTLRDNGIGRTASSLLKQNDAVYKKNYESRGMSMVQQRLKLLQEQYDKPFEAIVSDITDVQGNVQGTQVILKIFIGDKSVSKENG
jgi:two-component system LytT family sensor kinase